MDALSLELLSGTVLSEGIKFLYTQAAELVKHSRRTVSNGVPTSTADLASAQAAVLDQPLTDKPLNYEVVADHESELLDMRRGLADYVDGLVAADPKDRDLLQRVEALRGMLELAYGQRLTFRGESRPQTGSPLPTTVRSEVSSYVANVSAVGGGAIAIGGDNSGSISTATNRSEPA